MAALVERLRAARETWVEVDEFRLRLRRPTQAQVLEWEGLSAHQFVARTVVGWEGVREIDVLPGGMPTPLEFDAELCAEWIADNPRRLNRVMAALNDAVRQRQEELGLVEKKSAPPSNQPIGDGSSEGA